MACLAPRRVLPVGSQNAEAGTPWGTVRVMQGPVCSSGESILKRGVYAQAMGGSTQAPLCLVGSHCSLGAKVPCPPPPHSLSTWTWALCSRQPSSLSYPCSSLLPGWCQEQVRSSASPDCALPPSHPEPNPLLVSCLLPGFYLFSSNPSDLVSIWHIWRLPSLVTPPFCSNEAVCASALGRVRCLGRLFLPGAPTQDHEVQSSTLKGSGGGSGRVWVGSPAGYL